MSCPLTRAGCPILIDTKMNKTMRFAAVVSAFAVFFLSCDPQDIPAPEKPNEEQPDTLPSEKPDTSDINIEDEIPEIDPAYKELKHSVFTENDLIFPNPERGLYGATEFHSDSYSPLKANQITFNRKYGRTIAYLGYFMPDFIESDISDDYLALIRTNMETLRETGAKCILRFAYSNMEPSEHGYKGDEVPEDYPGRDASLEWVLRHIEQVKPILQEYSDVIMVYQAGYVGVWGEWYYTDNFESGPKTPEDHVLRKQVTDAMLAALPKDRQIALRTPMFTKNMYTVGNTYADSLTVQTAHNGTDRSRLSCFNDCFGADKTDRGTFGGNESRELWKKDSRYVFMGGETCGTSEYCKCERTLQDMKDYHWTYLNNGYHQSVLGRWRKDGCMDEIERRLGYRLSLTDVFCTPEPTAGADYRIVMKILNSGFSAPINPRAVELVLVDGNGNKTEYVLDDIDPRYWFAGQKYVIDKTIKIPADATGKCSLYLNLPDPKETLHDNPLFSIRLANDDIWEETTGYNKLAEFTL